MRPDNIFRVDPPDAASTTYSATPSGEGVAFDKTLEAAMVESAPPGPWLRADRKTLAEPVCQASAEALCGGPAGPGQTQGTRAVAAYRQQLESAAGPVAMSDYQKYKDDQLLRNPGGRQYYPDSKEVVSNPPDQRSFFGRIKKDLSDSFGNIKNFVGNMFFGSKFLYRDQGNEIREAQQRGLIGCLTDFCKDFGSALSLGSWHPGQKDPPRGFSNRLVYSASKLKDAFLGAIGVGIPSSLNHMGKNLLLAGWNLVEVLPDSIIGNFEQGKKVTDAVFDNGQVLVEYLTDVVPSGDAWLRVHASSLKELQAPVVYNLKMPEHYSGDARWLYVRNTRFRKSIETIGALLADGAAIGLIGQTGFSSNRHNRMEPL